jgi:hypothetical protein
LSLWWEQLRKRPLMINRVEQKKVHKKNRQEPVFFMIGESKKSVY